MPQSKKQTKRSALSTPSTKGRTGVRKSTPKHPANNRDKSPEQHLTFVEDRGTVYDAPIEVVWDFMLKDEKYHPKAHTADVRSFEGKELSEVTTLLSYEELRNGRWQKRVCRMTTIRPAVRVQEDLVGPYAGSMTIFLYTPRGEQTVVDVFGYAQHSELTPAGIKRDRKRVWSNAYTEDLPYFRRFARQHPALRRNRG